MLNTAHVGTVHIVMTPMITSMVWHPCAGPLQCSQGSVVSKLTELQAIQSCLPFSHDPKSNPALLVLRCCLPLCPTLLHNIRDKSCMAYCTSHCHTL